MSDEDDLRDEDDVCISITIKASSNPRAIFLILLCQKIYSAARFFANQGLKMFQNHER